MGEDLALFLLQDLLPVPGQVPLEMALDFIASLWELTNHQICVVAKAYVFSAMGEVTGGHTHLQRRKLRF